MSRGSPAEMSHPRALRAGLGVVLAGERQVESASPTLAHAFAAALAGLAGTAFAAGVAALVARLRSRLVRLLPAVATGVAVALLALRALMAAPAS